ncbi:helix-turn-helix domain-containing protein [Arthrobacter bambusae]|uniref:helix-turn-helix domain-containing protein n=1 Tax=Arthrobacter bambusae TaxID=1338426 RepID=UPI002789AAB7|nr:helix-turn-helix domain-containing protein [Arthrobacter bambusae]MDQ0241457.1 hypothetical protein [Arthrobacter bambusae]
MKPTSISHLDELVAVLITTDPFKRDIVRALENISRAEAGSAGSASESIEDLLWHFATIRSATDEVVKMLAVHLAEERGMPSRRVAKAARVTHTTVDRWAKSRRIAHHS